MRLGAIAGLVFLGILLGSERSDAATVEYAAAQHAVITSSGKHRVLVSFPSLSELASEWVSSAVLTVPAGGEGSAPELSLEVNALTTSWSAAATWTSPWSVPGGDRETSIPAGSEPVLRSGEAELAVDVTDIVRAFCAGDVQQNGFILCPSSPLLMGLSNAQLGFLGELSEARLTVRYRSFSEMGYVGGPKALLERRRSQKFDPDRARR